MAAPKGNKYPQKYTEEMIDDLCKGLIDFAEEDETVHFVKFAKRQGKTQTWLNRMAEDYPKFAEAYLTAKELMSEKLVRTSIYGHPTNNKFNATYAMEWKSVYCQEWKDFMKWKAEIQKEQIVKEENKAAFNEWANEQKTKSNHE